MSRCSQKLRRYWLFVGGTGIELAGRETESRGVAPSCRPSRARDPVPVPSGSVETHADHCCVATWWQQKRLTLIDVFPEIAQRPIFEMREPPAQRTSSSTGMVAATSTPGGSGARRG